MSAPQAIGEVAKGLGAAASSGSWTLQSLMPFFQQMLGIAPMLVDDEKKRNEMMKVLKGHAAGASLGDIATAMLDPMSAAGKATGKATGTATGKGSSLDNDFMKIINEKNKFMDPGLWDMTKSFLSPDQGASNFVGNFT